MSQAQATQNGNGIPKGYDIVEVKHEWGGAYDACGKCGARLHTCEVGDTAKNTMAGRLEERVLNPLGLMAGLLASVKEEEDDSEAFNAVGYLLGLIVTGSRKELEIQRIGEGGYWLSQLLENHKKGKAEGGME